MKIKVLTFSEATLSVIHFPAFLMFQKFTSSTFPVHEFSATFRPTKNISVNCKCFWYFSDEVFSTCFHSERDQVLSRILLQGLKVLIAGNRQNN